MVFANIFEGHLAYIYLREGGLKHYSFLVRKMFDNVIGRTKEHCVTSVKLNSLDLQCFHLAG